MDNVQLSEERQGQQEVINGFLCASKDLVQTEGGVTIPIPAACALRHSQADLSRVFFLIGL